MNLRNLYFLCGALFFILTGCIKRDFEHITLANTSPEYLYPLVDAELNLKNIVDPQKKKLYITEDADGFYTFIYYQDAFEQKISDLLQITDKSVNQTVTLTGGEITSLPVSGSVTKSFNSSLTLAATHGEQLKTLIIKSGSIPLNLSSTFKHNVSVTVTFPYVKKNNVALTKTVSLAYGGSVPVVSNNTLDLTGYTIDLSEGGIKVNTLSYTASMTVTFISGNPITAGQKLDFTSGLKDITYSYADGYIGSYTYTVPEDTVFIDIFNNAFAGNVYFEDPKVRAIISNSIGAPSKIKINTLTAVSNINGTIPITGSQINSDLFIAYPSLVEVGQAKSTTIQLDKTNSNVQTVFNPAPDQIIYKMTGTLNPSGVTQNFVTDTSKLSVRAEAEIPMNGKVTRFVLLDTLEGLTYPEAAIGNNVTIVKAGFTIDVVNGFPTDVFMQMYFLTDSNNVVDSMFAAGPQVIPSGTVDANGKVILPGKNLIKEIYDEARYASITKTTKAVIYVYFRTANNGADPVKIYSSYKIKTNIGLDVKANVSF